MSAFKICTVGRTVCRSASVRSQFKCLPKFYATEIQSSSGNPAGPRNNIKLLLISMGIGGALGTGYSGYMAMNKPLPGVTQQQRPMVIDKIPSVKVTRKIYNPKDKTDLDIVLFQYQTCPFCCKVRAYLDSQGLSYSVVEVDAVLRQSMKWSKYKKVPTMLVKRKDGKYIQLTDSSMIVSVLASFLTNPSQDIGNLTEFYPNVSYVDENGKTQSDVINKYFLMYQEEKLPRGQSKEQIEEERKWRSWADSHLVHLISPNVYRDTREALETFEWFAEVGEWNENFPRWERNLMVYGGAAAMWAIGKRLKKRHDLSDDVRWHLYKACDKWTDEIEKKKTKFLGGKQPNLADLNVYGVLNCMEGCQAFKDCLKNTNIAPWFYAMKEYVDSKRGTVISHQTLQFNVQSAFS